MSFASTWPLGLLVVIAWIWWANAHSRTDLSPKHRRVAAIVRSLAVLMLVCALMQPVWKESGSWLSVVYLLDVSESVSPTEVSAAIDWIESAERSGHPDHSRFIAFGANALVEDDLQSLRHVKVGETGAPDTVDSRATNLEEALDIASRSFASDHLRRLVLLTDGNQNSGEVRSILPGLRENGIEVFTRVLEARVGPDSWIEAIQVPRTVTQDELFPAEVHVYSQDGGPATISIRSGADGVIDERREVDLEAGINRIAFELRTPETGSITLEASVESERDRFTGNNVFRQAVNVAGAPRILYVEGRPESADYLRNALELESLEVEVLSPGELPNRPEQFDAYDTLILSDVRADLISEEQMEAIGTYVSDLGGGLILVGGESVFGEEGYSDTRLEEILPVRFDLEREPPTVALIIVLDKSGSMGGQKLELVKEASKAAVNVLRDDQMIGMVAFDYNHYWPFRLQPASNRVAIAESISTIVAGGETNIFPALGEAHQELMGLDTEIKHVILLSDGRSLPDDFRTLVEAMVEAGETVSTVAVGNGADRELLADIADWGQGRDYFIEDATRVPQVFTEETELATQGTLREDSFRPIVVKEVEALSGIDFSEAPPLLGFVATMSRDTAEVLLVSDDSDKASPILARWQYGLGKAVAFTSDAKDRWAAEWLDWEGYAQFWPQVVRETMRRHDNGEMDLEIERTGDSATVRLTSIERDGGFRTGLNPEVRAVDPEGNPVAIPISPTGPGTWQGRFDVTSEGPWIISASSDDLRASRTLAYSYPEEYHLYPPDTEILEEVSRVTGGVFDTTPEQIFNFGGESISRSRELWGYLAALALVFYLTDLGLRRVRLFDEPFATAGRTQRNASSPTEASTGKSSKTSTIPISTRRFSERAASVVPETRGLDLPYPRASMMAGSIPASTR